MDRPSIVSRLALASTLVVGMAAPVFAGPRKPAPIVKTVTVAPTKLVGGGYDVKVVVKTNKPGNAVYTLQAQATLPGAGQGPIVTLSKKNTTTFSGEVRVPVNYDKVAQKGTITVAVVSGGVVAETKKATVTVKPSDGTLPPPPPPTN